ncbi:MAG TPA: polysaccharide biosynthesis/export family protein, partial [Candidatus Acidoferrum sp.]|nr:polysaccharide biosynthesis/export family protein [Candidatus Acidoferrum sp.]
MRRKIIIALVEISLLAFSWAVFAQQAAQTPATPQQPAPGRYTLKASDVLGLTFRYTPDYNHDTSVQPDGFVQLKGLPNAVHIQGLTMAEAQREIVKAYSAIL